MPCEEAEIRHQFVSCFTAFAQIVLLLIVSANRNVGATGISDSGTTAPVPFLAERPRYAGHKWPAPAESTYAFRSSTDSWPSQATEGEKRENQETPGRRRRRPGCYGGRHRLRQPARHRRFNRKRRRCRCTGGDLHADADVGAVDRRRQE